jgi:hypothetical protein
MGDVVDIKSENQLGQAGNEDLEETTSKKGDVLGMIGH